MRFIRILHILFLLAFLLVRLLWILLILEWSIWRAKRRLERQLLMCGVPREPAKRISNIYHKNMNRNIREMFKIFR